MKLVSVRLGNAEHAALAELAARAQKNIPDIIREAVEARILREWPAGLERIGDEL